MVVQFYKGGDASQLKLSKARETPLQEHSRIEGGADTWWHVEVRLAEQGEKALKFMLPQLMVEYEPLDVEDVEKPVPPERPMTPKRMREDEGESLVRLTLISEQEGCCRRQRRQRRCGHGCCAIGLRGGWSDGCTIAQNGCSERERFRAVASRLSGRRRHECRPGRGPLIPESSPGEAQPSPGTQLGVNTAMFNNIDVAPRIHAYDWHQRVKNMSHGGVCTNEPIRGPTHEYANCINKLYLRVCPGAFDIIYGEVGGDESEEGTLPRLLAIERVSRALIRRTSQGPNRVRPHLSSCACVPLKNPRSEGLNNRGEAEHGHEGASRGNSGEGHGSNLKERYETGLGLAWSVGNRVSRALIRRTAQIGKERRGTLIR